MLIIRSSDVLAENALQTYESGKYRFTDLCKAALCYIVLPAFEESKGYANDRENILSEDASSKIL